MNQLQLEWYKSENLKLTQQVEQLVRDNHRLNASNKDLRKQLDTLSTSFTIGERGEVCLLMEEICERLF